MEKRLEAQVRPQGITTALYNVDPVRVGSGAAADASRISAYRVSNIMRIRVRDLPALGHIVDTAVAAGANVVRGIHFVLMDNSAARAAARERAIEAARSAAAQLARAAGVRLGPLLSVRETSGLRPVNSPIAMATLSAGGPGPVEIGEIAVSVTVEAHYRILRADDDG